MRFLQKLKLATLIQRISIPKKLRYAIFED